VTPEELRTAQELFRAVMDAPPRTDRVALIADAIRAQRTAAEASALERAAQVADNEACQLDQGNQHIRAAHRIADKIRALIPPAAAPAADLRTLLRMTTDTLIGLAPYPPEVAEAVMAIVEMARAALKDSP
jgi:hypothetical protein